MPSCVVKWCQSHSDRIKGSGISFHIFPQRNTVRKRQWIKAVQLERHEDNWAPNKHSKICSIHFKDKDFYSSKKGYTMLSKDAVPICTMVSSNQTPCIKEESTSKGLVISTVESLANKLEKEESSSPSKCQMGSSNETSCIKKERCTSDSKQSVKEGFTSNELAISYMKESIVKKSEKAQQSSSTQNCQMVFSNEIPHIKKERCTSIDKQSVKDDTTSNGLVISMVESIANKSEEVLESPSPQKSQVSCPSCGHHFDLQGYDSKQYPNITPVYQQPTLLPTAGSNGTTPQLCYIPLYIYSSNIESSSSTQLQLRRQLQRQNILLQSRLLKIKRLRQQNGRLVKRYKCLKKVV